MRSEEKLNYDLCFCWISNSTATTQQKMPINVPLRRSCHKIRWRRQLVWCGLQHRYHRISVEALDCERWRRLRWICLKSENRWGPTSCRNNDERSPTEAAEWWKSSTSSKPTKTKIFEWKKAVVKYFVKVSLN